MPACLPCPRALSDAADVAALDSATLARVGAAAVREMAARGSLRLQVAGAPCTPAQAWLRLDDADAPTLVITAQPPPAA